VNPITDLLDDLRAKLPAASRVITEGAGNDVPQSALRGDIHLVRAAVAATPNTSAEFPSRESYRDMGYAIKAALPDQPEAAYDIFAEWCERWDGGTNEPDVVAADWRRMKPPYRRGASWLYELADQHGKTVWFEPIEDQPENPFDVQAEATKQDAAADVHIKWVRPSEWSGQKPKPREWEVEGWIPRGEVTLLYGDGGIGKTLIAHQYATAAAAGVPWLGQPTRRARIMCFFCEDSEDELLRRQIDINTALGVTFEDTDEHLRIASRKYMDNLFILWDRNTGAMKRQAVWERLRDDALAFRADVTIVDTIADTFGGNEIDRGQVNAFIKSCLGRLAADTGGSVIALGHPSMSGKASGSGTSGSTAWSNAVRSRLYLRYPKGVEKGNVRELEGMKLNYGPKGNMLKLRWNRGAFDVTAASTAPVVAPSPDGVGNSDAIPPTIDQAADDLVFAAVQACAGAAMNLKYNSPHFAPRVLKMREPELLGDLGNDDVLAALQRLEGRGAVAVCEVGRDTSRRPIQGYRARQIVSETAPSVFE